MIQSKQRDLIAKILSRKAIRSRFKSGDERIASVGRLFQDPIDDCAHKGGITALAGNEQSPRVECGDCEDIRMGCGNASPQKMAILNDYLTISLPSLTFWTLFLCIQS